jgi:hypothetical protein
MYVKPATVQLYCTVLYLEPLLSLVAGVLAPYVGSCTDNPETPNCLPADNRAVPAGTVLRQLYSCCTDCTAVPVR